ncbi:MAG: hypothetical protein V1912_11340 [bacterium]
MIALLLAIILSFMGAVVPLSPVIDPASSAERDAAITTVPTPLDFLELPMLVIPREEAQIDVDFLEHSTVTLSPGWHISIVTFYDFNTWGVDRPGGRSGVFACGGGYYRDTIAAAHRTLPCGTLVEFRYKGRTLFVPVRDRFGGSGFDLTSAAAEALGHTFTGPVEWRVVHPLTLPDTSMEGTP